MKDKVELPEEIKVAESNIKVDFKFEDFCPCHPPLKMNSGFDYIYTTYNLDAICPHCKEPFKNCKPELMLQNLKTEMNIASKKLETIGFENEQELDWIKKELGYGKPKRSNVSLQELILVMVFTFVLVITIASLVKNVM